MQKHVVHVALRGSTTNQCVLGVAVLAVAALAAPVTAQDPITFLNSWGTPGTGNGQFRAAWGVAVGPTGTVYVTDRTDSRVEYFDRSGNYIGQLGTPGTGNGQLTDASNVAVSSAGTVYVSDAAGSRVEAFDSSGNFLFDVGSSGTGNGQFQLPEAITVAPNGNVYVSDVANRNIQEFTPVGTFITGWGSYGSTLGSFQLPYFMSYGPARNVFVSDNGNGLVQRFDASGNVQTGWSASSPNGIGVAGTGDVYVASGNGGGPTANTITKYDSSGNVLASFGGPGSGSGQFNNPRGVAVAPTGEVYVADLSNNRVERWFDPDAWVSGTNAFTTAAVGPGQLLGTTQTLSAGKTLNSATTTVNSGGTLTLAGGSLNTIDLILSGAGATFQVASGSYSISSFQMYGGATYQVSAGQTFSVTSNTVIASGSTLSVSGTLSSSAAGVRVIGNGKLTLAGGTVDAGSGGVNNTGVISGWGQILGPLTNNNGGEVRVAAGQQLWFSDTSAHSNAGLISVIGGPTGLADIAFSGALTNAASTGLITTQGGGDLHFDGGLINNGSLAASFGQMNVFGDVTNNASGKITVGVGANATFYGDVVQNGVLTIPSGNTVEMFGAFSGSGGFTGGGTLRQDGDLRPGNSPALINLGGNLIVGASSTYHMELGGTTIGSQYDSIAVSNAATLGGTLEVDLINGFHPSLAEQFTALTWGSETGDFANYADLAVGGHLTLRHAFVGNSLILTARPTVDGDINLDGVVNGLDIAAVSSHWLLSGSAGINGDANGDGVVNGLDIALIAAHWLQTGGAGGGSGSAVPEPSTAILAVAGALALLLRRRRRCDGASSA
jgi:streptogramin lyase